MSLSSDFSKGSGISFSRVMVSGNYIAMTFDEQVVIRTLGFEHGDDLVDHDILGDAGTGVEDLSVEQLAAIDHVFLTHSHHDHSPHPERLPRP